MSGLAALLLAGLGFVALAGLVLCLTAFHLRVEPAAPPLIPPAQVINGLDSPFAPAASRRSLEVALGRLIAGIILLALGSAGLVFARGLVELAALASH